MTGGCKVEEHEELYQLRKFPTKGILSVVTSPSALLAFVVSPLIVALLGAASRGDVFLYAVLAWLKWDDFGITTPSFLKKAGNATEEAPKNMSAGRDAMTTGLDGLLHHYRLDNVHYIVASAILFSYVIFFGLGGFLQWHYYIQKKDSPSSWKCQPNRFLTTHLHRQEVLLGAFNLFLGASLSGVLATLVLNGSSITTLYFNVADYGWTYLIVTTVLTFLFQDASAYYIHRTLHWPYFYKKFHKIHHRYYSPTAFGAVAMHPAEFLTLQFALVIPMFTVPVHFVSFLACVMYSYYYGMIDHSGIDLEAFFWPWQPPVRFHDDHHKYFHVNFGFNTLIFDRYHDTLRKKTRFYSEAIFGGKGAQAANGRKEE